jgi:UDP-2-acetamido-2,6-beta-L-arabino-hexul-4-ose reductase
LIRVGITGAHGFLGWHVRALLRPDPGIQVLPAGRELFSDAGRLRDFVKQVDAIVHLAGANRDEEREIRATNVGLAEQLVSACDAAGARPQIVFANSTHSARASAYGESKRVAAETLAAWSKRSGASFANLVLPNVFGEGCRPFYNSAVATFCHQLAGGEEPRVIEDIELELVHAQDAAAAITTAVRDGRSGETRVQGTAILVSAVLTRLQTIAQQYKAHLIPELASRFELDLFNSYRSYLFPERYPVDLELRQDARGSLFEAVKTLRGGQCFLSTTRPGVTRGNHYHRRKLERFLVLQGDAVIRVRRLLGEEITEFRVSGARPQYVDMPTLHTHNITNVGAGELITLFWSQEIFDAAHPDTFAEPV